MDLGIELDKSNKEIFRFESLQEYFSDRSDEIEKEISRQFKETGEIDMDLMKEWHDFIRKKVQSGVKFNWVRLVEFPLNDYTKFTLYIYKKRILHGINIRIITREKLDELKIDVKDFYLIDEKTVLLMRYGKLNEYLDCEPDNENLGKYKKYKDLLMDNSISISDSTY